MTSQLYQLSWRWNADASYTKEEPRGPLSPSLGSGPPDAQISATMISYKLLNQDKMLAYWRTILRVFNVYSPHQPISMTWKLVRKLLAPEADLSHPTSG